jgi:hypothetical protein
MDDSGSIDGQGKVYVWAGISLYNQDKSLTSALDPIFSSFDNSPGYREKKGLDATFREMEAVFRCLVGFSTVRISYLVVDKSLVTSNQKTFVKGAVSKEKEQSENYFLSKVVKRLSFPYDVNDKHVNLIIDGSPNRVDSVSRLHEYLSVRINYPEWNTSYSWNNFKIVYDPSINNRLLQAADFVANLILEYYKLMEFATKKNPIAVRKYAALYSILKPKITHRLYRMKGISVL